MKTRNTRELVLRARAHARADHIKQGTYGSYFLNGKRGFQGCAVGCLSTPHRKADAAKFWAWVDQTHGARWNGANVSYLELDEEEQRDLVTREFGLTPPLVVLAEGFFEAQTTHGAAINFVRDFAEAIPEGIDITPRMVKRFRQRVLDLDYDVDCYTDVMDAVRSGWRGGKVKQRTEELLEWLRSLASETKIEKAISAFEAQGVQA